MTEIPLWTPSAEQVAASGMTRFRITCETRAGRPLADSADLHAWSIEKPAAFWETVWDHCGVVGTRGVRALTSNGTMRGTRFFPDAELNFAENLLRTRGSADALVFRGEDKAESRWSWDDLRAMVSRLQQALV
ncbi:acetyl-coenzyme A synthetase N-terminal domain-containing protein, partial [Methylobrevis pamukkalensis]|uniref:acetyl-coenzyme A synthetase N-terminal domain-containing protein n=1 Tax=Methylobrevis pamukkalensis TaxID=1439726 RepID=UPI002477DA99